MLAFFNELLVRPLFNALIFITDALPGESFALAIIILTVIIRLILLGPSAKAIRSQREMQKITPELDKIKKKYAGDQQKIAEETMKLFKQHGVNPMGGCLPLLIQLPILWAFFWVLKAGVTGDLPELYSFVQMPEHINLSFFWVPDITLPDPIWIPILVALFQFIQMKTVILRANKKKQEAGQIKNEQAMAQNIMTYVMPLLIGWIARSLSAGLGIYWITTAIFSTAQQGVIAWKEARDKKQN